MSVKTAFALVQFHVVRRVVQAVRHVLMELARLFRAAQVIVIVTTPDFLAWLGAGNYWIQGTDPWGNGSRALIYIHPNKKMNWGSFNLGYFYNKNYALCH